MCPLGRDRVLTKDDRHAHRERVTVEPLSTPLEMGSHNRNWGHR